MKVLRFGVQPADDHHLDLMEQSIGPDIKLSDNRETADPDRILEIIRRVQPDAVVFDRAVRTVRNEVVTQVDVDCYKAVVEQVKVKGRPGPVYRVIGYELI